MVKEEKKMVKKRSRYEGEMLVGYEGLTIAILRQASADYRFAKFNMRPNSEYILKECERFFNSSWYEALTTVEAEEFKRRSIGKICTAFVSINDIIYVKDEKRLLLSISDLISLAPLNIAGGNMYSRIELKWRKKAEEYAIVSEVGTLRGIRLWDIDTAIKFLQSAHHRRPNAAAIEKEIKKSAKLARKILKIGAEEQC